MNSKLEGQRFHRLLVVGWVRPDGERLRWKCVCDCGNDVLAYSSHLKSGGIRSCGCLKAENNTARNKANAKHGMWRSNEFAIWSSMLNRCYVKSDKGSYPRYGGRGILVCERWRTDFTAFLADMGPRPSRNHSLERVDNDRGYEPGNVVWATRIEQQNNRHNNVLVTVNGETMTATQLARKHGINDATMFNRVRAGKTGADLIAPVKPRKRRPV